jgi:hypothetical protein
VATNPVRYVHWRGEFSLFTSVFVNGLAILVFLVLVAWVGLALGAEDGGVFVGAWAVAYLLWLVWALVGIFRSGIRNYRSPESSIARRVFAVCAMIGVLTVCALMVWDLIRLFG